MMVVTACLAFLFSVLAVAAWLGETVWPWLQEQARLLREATR